MLSNQRRRAVISRISALMLLSVAVNSAVAESDNDALLKAVQDFYGWVLQHGKEVAQMQPAIKDVKDSTRFYLDTSSMDDFTAQFMKSGYFSAEFAQAVSAYYNQQKTKIDTMSQQEFDQIAKDGRGPMLETEDMDIYFCAQEYEYKPEFVQGMKIKSAAVTDDTATAVVESPYQWDTEFKFHKNDGRWQIAGYCVYK